MAVRTQHEQEAGSIYFITFTCYNWMPLFEQANAYDLVYRWFDYLFSRKIRVAGYVMMPNHVHVLLYFPEMKTTLNNVIGNGKRFMAYGMIEKLKAAGREDVLTKLRSGVSKREEKKGQHHKVFEESFDAKLCNTKEFVFRKLDYIHHNPVSGKWMLAADFIAYPHSSAVFYETGQGGYTNLLRIEEVM